MRLKDEGLSDDALDMIAAEDISQREKWGNQNHSPEKWYVILGEEFGELGKAILECKPRNVEKEAIQVATLGLKIAYMMRKNREAVAAEYESLRANIADMAACDADDEVPF